MTDALVPVELSAFSIGQVVSRTFSVIGRNFILFFLLAALTSLPLVLMALAMQPTGNPAEVARIAFSGRYWITFGASMLIWVVLSFLLNAVLTFGTVMDLNGRQVSLSEALSVALRLFFPLIAIAILYTLGIWIGFIALIVPGLMLLTAWAVVVPVRVIENTTIADTFSRSSELTKGHRWAIFGLFLALGTVIVVLTLVTRPIMTAASAAQIGGLPVLYAFADVVVRAITAVISATGTACLYYELRVSKEGVGPNQLAAVFD